MRALPVWAALFCAALFWATVAFPVGALAGPLLQTQPSDRFRTGRIEVEYQRPWGDVAVQQGRLVVGLPAGGLLWLGLSTRAVTAPTVDEFEVGIWVRASNWLRAEFSRGGVRVEGLPALTTFNAELDLRLVTGPWSLGWSAEFDALGDAAARGVVRRFVWAGYAGRVCEVSMGRRSQPWTDRPRWEVAVEFVPGTRFRLGLFWRDAESVFSLGWGTGAFGFGLESVWTGPRAGGFGFRIAERR